jgi:arginine repressor
MSMGKSQRHTAIRTLVQEHRVGSQEQLRELLVSRGFDVTQATLSRDIRELRLVKMPDPEGNTFYEVPDTDQRPALARLLPTLFIGAEGTGNLLVVKTLAGGAQAKNGPRSSAPLPATTPSSSSSAIPPIPTPSRSASNTSPKPSKNPP